MTSLIALAVTLPLGACAVVRQDEVGLRASSNARAESQWGCSYTAGGTRGQNRCFRACAAASRIKTLSANDRRYGRITYRRLTVFDGDAMGSPGTERCELGRNERRYGEGNYNGTFKLYREGAHLITTWMARVPSTLPFSGGSWRVVMQMKPTQPHGNLCLGGSCGPSGYWPGLALDKVETSYPAWTVTGFPTPAHPGGRLWTQPVAFNRWTPIVFDVRYSRNPRAGFIRVRIGNVTSPTMYGQTLSTTPTALEGIPAGGSIPAHLRMGIYQNDGFRCGWGACSIDFAGVKVMSP